jgi:D-glycero-alpha-D-manno-heptose-7-phosphate kinase
VRIEPYTRERILISSKGLAKEEYVAFETPFQGKLGLVAAIASHFGLHGLAISIESEFPPRSGLGGSGALAVAVIGALNEARVRQGYRRLSKQEIVLLAQRIENDLGLSLTGLQDQAAAAYGGVNRWIWHYSRSSKPFSRHPLVSQNCLASLEEHIVVAFTGVEHDSSDINRLWLEDFLQGGDRHIWYEILSLTDEFASAISVGDWRKAATLLSRENDLRVSITPGMVPDYTHHLLEEAKSLACGARFSGAGGGGCVWAIGERERIRILATHWKDFLNPMGGYLLPTRIARKGLIIRKKVLPHLRKTV